MLFSRHHISFRGLTIIHDIRRKSIFYTSLETNFEDHLGKRDPNSEYIKFLKIFMNIYEENVSLADLLNLEA